MSDVLSPDEVDALLEGVSNGAIDSGASSASELDATPYDLTATDHISRSDLPSMDLLNQGFARRLKKSFRSELSDGVDVTVGDVIEEKFSDYVASLPDPTMFYLIQLPLMHSEAVFVLSSELIQKYVDIYFGGSNKGLEGTPKEGFTSAETRVARQILNFALRDFELAWKPVAQIEANLIKSESSPQFCKFIESAAPTVISKFDVKLDEANEGSISCVLLSSMLLPLYEKLDASNRGSQTEHRNTWTRELKEQLVDIKLKLSSPIARKKYSLGKLVRLKAGDIIPIELDTQVSLKASNIELFRGKFGISKNKNSVRIEEIV